MVFKALFLKLRTDLLSHSIQSGDEDRFVLLGIKCGAWFLQLERAVMKGCDDEMLFKKRNWIDHKNLPVSKSQSICGKNGTVSMD